MLYRSQQMSSSENGRPSIRIGVGAGTADDRIHPAVQLAQHGEPDYLVFECLAERTVARENLTRSKDPVLAVGFLVIGAAEVLEKTYGFNWWLTTAATAMIVAPILWLYLRRSKNGRQEQPPWGATE
jgi:hypothetical protein